MGLNSSSPIKNSVANNLEAVLQGHIRFVGFTHNTILRRLAREKRYNLERQHLRGRRNDVLTVFKIMNGNFSTSNFTSSDSLPQLLVVKGQNKYIPSLEGLPA